MGRGELGADCARNVISGEHRSTASREEKANRVSSTSQIMNFLALFLGKMMSVLVYEMTSYPLGAGPRVITKRALRRDFMLVHCMPLKLLESSVFFVAIIITAEPILGTPSTILDTLGAPPFRHLPVIYQSYGFSDLIVVVLVPKEQCWVCACCAPGLLSLWW
jgi:hypothetical protein